MRVENKEYYYFEDKDKLDFLQFLTQNGMMMTTFANKCDISLSLLSLIINGKRAITKNVIDEFGKNGFKVNI